MKSKKAQGMVLDMVMLVLIVTMFFIFLSSQLGNKTEDTGVIRSQSSYIQHLMLSTLNYQIKSGTYENATIAEMIGMYHCGESSIKSEINSTITNLFNILGKENHYFIFISEVSEYNRIASYNNLSCVKTETINLARFKMDLPCSKTAEIQLGIWPSSQKVESC